MNQRILSAVLVAASLATGPCAAADSVDREQRDIIQERYLGLGLLQLSCAVLIDEWPLSGEEKVTKSERYEKLAGRHERAGALALLQLRALVGELGLSRTVIEQAPEPGVARSLLRNPEISPNAFVAGFHEMIRESYWRTWSGMAEQYLENDEARDPFIDDAAEYRARRVEAMKQRDANQQEVWADLAKEWSGEEAVEDEPEPELRSDEYYIGKFYDERYPGHKKYYLKTTYKRADCQDVLERMEKHIDNADEQ